MYAYIVEYYKNNERTRAVYAWDREKEADPKVEYLPNGTLQISEGLVVQLAIRDWHTIVLNKDYTLQPGEVPLPSTPRGRVVLELEDLTNKLTKLEKFLSEPIAITLSAEALARLRMQRDVMTSYHNILVSRLDKDFK